jgi:DNA-binding XRE family transcriptional regulator
MGDVVTIDRREYDTLRARIQELEDIVHMRRVEAAVVAGASEWLPATMVRRLCEGEPPLLVWREHRGLSRSALAEVSGLSLATIDAVEAGRHRLTLDEAVRLARALAVDLDDLAATED